MNNYCVTIREVRTTEVCVEAENSQAAILAVRNGEGVYGDSEHLNTLDPSTWDVTPKD